MPTQMETPVFVSGLVPFEGVEYSKQDSHCQQGQKVQVSDWKPLEGECPQTKK
jgi:hypothetical protein